MTPVNPSLSVAERVDAACDRFEQEWRARRRPRVDAYVAAAAEGDRPELRRQLPALESELEGNSAADTSVTRSSVRSGAGGPSDRTVQRSAERADVPAAVGRFEVRGVLGNGAFGMVYRAFDPHLGREVAVKVPLGAAVGTAGDRERFLKEARAAATINHPNVCQIHEVGEHDGRPYIVMAVVPGQSLADVLKGRKVPLPEKQAALVVRKVALALAAAHERGIVHRDLKPANVMFDRERRDVVVMDFGLARGPRPGDARGTQSGVILGTPAYMSPEQASGGSKGVGPAADVYSLGVVLYELLTGTRPFAGTATEVIGQILHVEPEKPTRRRAGIDPRLESICLKAMAKRPDERFASMKELAAAALDAVVRTPKPAGGSAATARADATRRDGEASTSSVQMADVFAAMSDERKATAAAVEAAVQRHRTPRWVFAAIGLGLLLGFGVLGGVVFFTRSDKVSVDLTVVLKDVDLADRTLSFFLNDEPLSAEALAKPVELKPGDHVFTVKRGKEVVKRVLISVAGGKKPGMEVQDITPPPPTPPPGEDKNRAERSARPPAMENPDRKAAEYMLSLGGVVKVNDESKPIRQAADLPAVPYKLTAVHMADVKALDDDGLACLKDCPHLTELDLRSTRVTEKGLAIFRGKTNFTSLGLAYLRVTDTGLEVFQGNTRLTALYLHDTWVTDKGLALFRDCKELETLWVGGTGVTDDGIRPFQECQFLKWLDVRATKVTPSAAREFRDALPRCRVDR